MKKFEVTKRNFMGKWISAPDSYLTTLEEFAEVQNINSKWIWPEPHVRGHLGYSFPVTGDLTSATLEIISDTIIDVFINGTQVTFETKSSGIIDVKPYIKCGNNRIAVRAYQTDTPLHFVTAMRGGIKLIYSSGNVKYIDTNKDWITYEVCNFGQGTEPDDWTTNEDPTYPGREHKPIICTNIHPRLVKRSCYFKKTLRTCKAVKKATLYSTAKGLYEFYINGKRTDDSILAPGIKQHAIEYQSTDVTALLNDGTNFLAAQLGNGWYNGMSWGEVFANKPMLLCDLVIEYIDGSQDIFSTDETWNCIASPLYEDDIQFGERYDARLNIPNWNGITSNDIAWQIVETQPVTENIIEQKYPPIKRHATLKPIKSLYLNKTTRLFQFATNQASRAMIKINNAKAGSIVKIRHCERLIDNEPCFGTYIDVFYPHDSYPDGKAPWNVRNTDVYICNDDKHQEYSPSFTYTGASYVYVESDDIDLENIEVSLSVIHSCINKKGFISTDYKLINDIKDITERTFLSNMFSGPTDCPSREKNFWNGDIQAFCPTALWYGDCFDLLATWSLFGRKYEYDVYGWEDEEYILPLTMYKFYGDTEFVKAKYKRTLDLFEERRARFKGILPFGMRSPYRDHLGVDNKLSEDFFCCAFYVYSLKQTAYMASLCNDSQTEAKFNSLYIEAKKEFNKVYYNAADHDYGQDCQAGIVLPLMLDITEDDKNALVKHLVEYIKANDYHLTTGFITTPQLLPILCDYGYKDVAWKVFTQKTFPSWQNMIDTGTTTITEDWYGLNTNEYGASLNHFALGSVCEWFFEYLGGIKPLKPGFKEIQIKPYFFKEIGKYSVKYESVSGTIYVSWEYIGEKINLNIITPVKTTVIYKDKSFEVEQGEHSFEF